MPKHKTPQRPDSSKTQPEALGESLWGGGYAEAMHPSLVQLSVSLPDDMVIADADLRGSAAYARALGRAQVLSYEDAQRLSDGLDAMRRELRDGAWQPRGHEDVHSAIEAEITQRLGPLGERLHTGRSRNDQVSTAFRLTLSEHIDTNFRPTRYAADDAYRARRSKHGRRHARLYPPTTSAACASEPLADELCLAVVA